MTEKRQRRMNTKALEVLAARTNAPKSENDTDSPQAEDSNISEKQYGISLVMGRNIASARARSYGLDLVDVLHEIATTRTERTRDRLEAIRLILDRGFGRPAVVEQQVLESPPEIEPNLAGIAAQGEAVEWLNSGKPQSEWPQHVLEHLGLDESDHQ